MPPKKKNNKPQKSAIDKDFRLQAVILADSYQARFQPLTKDFPRCLLPLANTPLLEYTFEFLAKAGVCEVFLMCCSHADKIEDYIKKSKWSDSHSPFEIHTKKLTESMSVGDAMRDLDGTGSITSDFLLVSGDVVSNIDFTPVLEQHLQRKQDDKNAMMTMVLRQADAFHRTRSRIEPGLFVLNDKTSECLRYEELTLNNPTGSIDVDGELLNDDVTLSIRNDLIDCHIDLCSIDVLAQFTENFDYSTLRSDFVKNILTSEILGKKIYAHIVTDAYAARVRSLQTYSAVTKDIVSRYSYPVVPDSNLMDDQTFSYQMGHIYKEKGVVLAQSCVIGSRSLVGRGTSVGERSLVKDTVIGRDCKIATNVNLVDSFIWSNVIIEDDVTVNGGLVADGAILKKGCSIGPGSIIGHGVTVEEGQKVEGSYYVLDGDETVPFVAVDEDDSDFDTDDEFNANVGSLVYNLKELNLSDTSINDHCYEDDENIRAVAPKKKTRRRLSSTVSNVSDSHEDEFQKEAIASLDRAFQDNHEIDIAALELGTLRMSSNVPYEEVRAASVKAINGYITRVLNMGVTDDHKVPTQKVWGKWAELFEKQVFEPADQLDLLNILLKDCSRRPVGNYILFAAVQSLYDADVLDEHVIVRWWHQQPEDVSPEIASVRTLLGKWVTWLEEAESESDDDEESE